MFKTVRLFIAAITKKTLQIVFASMLNFTRRELAQKRRMWPKDLFL